MQTETLIIGAGISGLSAAHFLQKKKQDFLLLEASDRVGGNIYSETIDGFLCENGPNTVLLNNRSLLQLIEDLDLMNQLCKPDPAAAHNRFVLHDDELTKVPTNPLQFFSTSLLSLKDKLRLLAEPFIKKHKEDVNLADFARRRFGQGFYEQFLLPFTTGIYAGNPEKMSAKHSFKLLWEMEQKHGSVFKGFVKRQKEQQSSGLPKVKMFSFPKGLGQLTDTIAASLGDKLHLKSAVVSIEKTATHYIVHTEDSSIQCQRIICTSPAPITASFLPSKLLKEELFEVPYVPIDVFHFGFEREHVQKKVPGFGLLTKETDKKHFLGLLFNSRIFPHTAPSKQELFTMIVGGDRQPELCKLSREDLEALLLDDLDKVIGLKGKPTFKKHIRYHQAIPQYSMRQAKLHEEIERFKKEEANFHLLVNYAGGISVSDCVQKADELINNL
jgi:protoporphyrinogen/coproporphyrinogen III oxidase